MLIVTDPDENSDTTFQRIAVHSVNDMPNIFALVRPRDQAVINTWESDFLWRSAVQNEWELDTVRYTLHFRTEMAEYSIEGILDTIYANLDMMTLGGWLGIEPGAAEHEVEWWVSAVDEGGIVNSGGRFTFIIPVEIVT